MFVTLKALFGFRAKMFQTHVFATKLPDLNAVQHICIGKHSQIIYVVETRNSEDQLVDTIQTEDGTILATFKDVRGILWQNEVGLWVLNYVQSSNEMRILLIHERIVDTTATLAQCNSALAMCISGPNQICIARQCNIPCIWTLTNQNGKYILSMVNHSLLSLNSVTDICATLDNKLVITQGYPHSCIKFVQDNQFQQVGHQASVFQQILDGSPDTSTFRDIAQCKVDVHNTCVILDNNWSAMSSIIRLVSADMYTSTLNLFSPIIMTIAIRKDEILASEPSGNNIWVARTPYIQEEYTDGLHDSPNVRLVLHDLQFNVTNSDTTHTFHSHKQLAEHHSGMLKAYISDGRSSVNTPDGTSPITCIAMLDIMSNVSAAKLYTTETLLDTLKLADYYGISIVANACTVQVLARISFSLTDLLKALEYCEDHSSVEIECVDSIREKLALQILPRMEGLSNVIATFPSMCKITFDLLSQAMNQKIATVIN